MQEGNKWSTPFYASRFRGVKPPFDLIDSDTGEVIAEAEKKITPRFVKEIEEAKAVKEILVPFESIIGRFASNDIVDEKTGEIWLEAGEEITCDFDQKSGSITGGNLKVLFDNGVTEISTLDIDNVNVGPYLRNTMVSDKNFNREMALEDIYKVMRPGEPPTTEAAATLFDSLFFDEEKYDLSAVGRVKLNMRLDLDAPDTMRTLRKDDIVAVIKALVALKDGKVKLTT